MTKPSAQEVYTQLLITTLLQVMPTSEEELEEVDETDDAEDMDETEETDCFDDADDTDGHDDAMPPVPLMAQGTYVKHLSFFLCAFGCRRLQLLGWSGLGIRCATQNLEDAEDERDDEDSALEAEETEDELPADELKGTQPTNTEHCCTELNEARIPKRMQRSLASCTCC